MTDYAWTPATLNDANDIANLARDHFSNEIDSIFEYHHHVAIRNATMAVVNQHFYPHTEIISICKDKDNNILAYTWAKSNEVAPWSDERMVSVRMAHVDLKLNARLRIRLINDMMTIWENFAHFAGVPVICSTTMRREQDAFLKLHSKRGYDVRGSYAYKRIVPLNPA